LFRKTKSKKRLSRNQGDPHWQERGAKDPLEGVTPADGRPKINKRKRPKKTHTPEWCAQKGTPLRFLPTGLVLRRSETEISGDERKTTKKPEGDGSNFCRGEPIKKQRIPGKKLQWRTHPESRADYSRIEEVVNPGQHTPFIGSENIGVSGRLRRTEFGKQKMNGGGATRSRFTSFKRPSLNLSDQGHKTLIISTTTTY